MDGAAGAGAGEKTREAIMTEKLTPDEEHAAQLRSDFACTLWRLITMFENERLERSVIREVLAFMLSQNDDDWWGAMASIDARSSRPLLPENKA